MRADSQEIQRVHYQSAGKIHGGYCRRHGKNCQAMHSVFERAVSRARNLSASGLHTSETFEGTFEVCIVEQLKKNMIIIICSVQV